MKTNTLFILAFALPVFALSPVPLLDREIQSFESNLSTDNLWPLCQRIDQPCGMEELEINDPRLNGKPAGTPPTGQNVRDALDSIVARAPEYRWKFHEEYAINIEPREIQKDDPLDRILKRVSLKGMSSTRAALNVLHAAHALGSFQPPGNFRLRKIKDLELKNVSVREALNKIVIADGHAMWIVSPVNNKGRLSLFFGLWADQYQIAEHDLKGSEYDEEMKRIRESWSEWNVR